MFVSRHLLNSRTNSLYSFRENFLERNLADKTIQTDATICFGITVGRQGMICSGSIVTGMIMAFTLSIDDFVISYFTSGTTQTLPIDIYSMTRKRISPEINALSTVLFVCIMLLLIIINVRQGREERRAKKAERERA